MKVRRGETEWRSFCINDLAVPVMRKFPLLGILGGHLAPYFTEPDIRFMYDEIRRLCPFEESDDFIHISKMPSHNITIGIALPYIRSFLDDIDSSAQS